MRASTRGAILTLAMVPMAATAARGQTTEIRLGGLLAPTHRNVLETGDGEHLGEARGTLAGGEFVARGTGGGLMVRYLGTEFTDGTAPARGRIQTLDGRLLLGPRVFTVEVGYTRWATDDDLFGDRGEDLWRAGARSSVGLGPSGLSIMLAGGASFRWDSGSEGSNSSGSLTYIGLDAETGVVYQAPRNLPFFAMLGYRFARHEPRPRLVGPDGAQVTVLRREEYSSVVLSAGLRLLKWRKD